MKNVKRSLEDIGHILFHVYSRRSDGRQGMFLGNVVAKSKDEALEDAKRLFGKHFKHGVLVINASHH